MYKIIISKTAQKYLDRLPNNLIKRIVKKIDELAENPRPHGFKPLEGRSGFRVRVGDFRIIYEINESIVTVYVIDIGARGGIYKKK